MTVSNQPSESKTQRAPRVTVILCSYNQGRYVEQAVKSVQDQTYGDWELIVIDNGSTDSSHELLRRYADDSRIRLHLHTDNKAIGARFNEGIDLARGEFVSFLYSDDWYTPDKLAQEVGRMDALDGSFGVVYGYAMAHGEDNGRRWRLDGFTGSGQVLRDLIETYRTAPIDMLSPLVRIEAYRRYRFYEDIFAEGEACFLKLAMSYKFSYIDRPMVVMRNHSGNRGRALERNASMTFRSLDRLAEYPEFPPDCRKSLRRMRANLWAALGWAAARLNMETRWGLSCYRNALMGSWKTAFQIRTAVGVPLLMVPPALRAPINAVGHSIRRHPGNQALVSDYGGAVAQVERSRNG